MTNDGGRGKNHGWVFDVCVVGRKEMEDDEMVWWDPRYIYAGTRGEETTTLKKGKTTGTRRRTTWGAKKGGLDRGCSGRLGRRG